MNSMRSVKVLMEYILQDLYSNIYYDIIMLELPQLLVNKEIDLKEFFKKEECEGKEFDDDDPNNEAMQPLCIEKPLISDNLINYTPIMINFLNLHEFHNIHQKEVEMEICDLLVQRDSIIVAEGENEASENFEIEHSYIDFKFLIIGEKIRVLDDPIALSQCTFDDEYFAKLILE